MATIATTPVTPSHHHLIAIIGALVAVVALVLTVAVITNDGTSSAPARSAIGESSVHVPVGTADSLERQALARASSPATPTGSADAIERRALAGSDGTPYQYGSADAAERWLAG
jgi:hypothetical protein